MSMTSPDGVNVTGYKTRKRTPTLRKRFNPAKSKLPVILLIILLVYVTFSFGTRFNSLYAMQQDVREMQEQVDDLAKKNTQLRKQLDMVKSDAYIEEVAREKLGLVRAGEVRVVPVQDPDTRN